MDSTPLFPRVNLRNQKSRNNIEKLGIKDYNVYNISDYAGDSFLSGRYDEVEAEHYVKKFLNIKR